MKGEYDRYEPYNPKNGLKRCPWCGEDLDETETVETLDGRTGPTAAMAMGTFKGAAGIRLYHPRCKRKRELIRHRVEHQTFDDLLEAP